MNTVQSAVVVPVIEDEKKDTSRAYRYYALVLLVIVGVSSWLDRQAFSILIEPIKKEMNLTDTQLGLLGGVAFGLFYATVGLPVAWLADRVSRRNVISIAMALWSGMTALCGAATGFGTLFLARMGVGVGEAGCSAPAQSFIASSFPKERRAFVLGIYFTHMPLGILIAFLAGGWLAEHYGWRATFMLFGIPGLAIALLARLTLREPAREKKTAVERGASLPQTVRFLCSIPSMRHLALGGALHGIGGYAAAVWTPSFLIRVHDMTLTQAGFYMAMAYGVAGFIGSFVGGRIADGIVRRTGDVRWYPRFVSIAMFMTVPFWALVYIVPGGILSAMLVIVPCLFNGTFLGPVTAGVQNLAGRRRGAMAAAFYLFLSNLIAVGLGPFIVGALSDQLHSLYGDGAMRYALLGLVPVMTLWASAHFWHASRTMRRDCAKADREDEGEAAGLPVARA